MQFPQRDLTNQFISTSYQDVVQRFSTGSIDYLLDGYGFTILGVLTSSINSLIVTQDQLPTIKSGFISSSTFGGTPLTSSVTYTKPFISDYSLVFSADDARLFTIDSKSANGFTVNSNTDVTFSGSVYWQAITYGEYN